MHENNKNKQQAKIKCNQQNLLHFISTIIVIISWFTLIK